MYTNTVARFRGFILWTNSNTHLCIINNLPDYLDDCLEVFRFVRLLIEPHGPFQLHPGPVTRCCHEPEHRTAGIARPLHWGGRNDKLTHLTRYYIRTLLDGVDYELIDFHFQECVHVDICVRLCQNRKRDSKKREIAWLRARLVYTAPTFYRYIKICLKFPACDSHNICGHCHYGCIYYVCLNNLVAR